MPIAADALTPASTAQRGWLSRSLAWIVGDRSTLTGTPLRVRFKLPGAESDTEANGRVVWSQRRLGMGVQFEAVDVLHQTQIDSFVDAHISTARKS